ncbi:MAG: cysteine desulfurase-like protein [Terriglobia bacterium]|jgi:cysteine desulfurase family protein (TIGR01976 family)|nr:cysteine desulfurase-like protein [Terriglobia bacterium]
MSLASATLTSPLAAHSPWIREQFPSLALRVNGHPAVYFDGPGGTQVPQRVIDAMTDYFLRSNSNTGGAYETSRRSNAIVSAARSAISDLLGCRPGEVAFGPNMTTLTFALSRSIGREIAPGDEIITTGLDHDADVAPWRTLTERGAVICEVDVNLSDCTLDLDDFKRKLSSKTKLVAVGYASNSVGTINPVAEIAKLAHSVGAMFFVDAVHYAPHGPIDVHAIDCDFLACSVYKFFGPHIGVLYGKHEHLARLQPYKVRPSADTVPDRWETGTHNIEGLAGVSGAITYLADLGALMDPKAQTRREALQAAFRAIKQYERELAERLVRGLQKIPGVQIYGIQDFSRFDQRTPTVAIRIGTIPPVEIAEKLGDHGIFVWDGNYYALNLSERLGVEDKGGMVRIGLAHYNTAEEVDRLLEELKIIAE